MPALRINSLIANLPPGRLAPTGPGRANTQAPAADPGVIFTQGEPWRNVANGASQVGYGRQDARGGLTRGGGEAPSAPGPSATGSPPASNPEGGTLAPEKDGQGSPAESAKGSESPTPGKKPNGELLSRAELDLVRELQQADQAVKAHEMAHLAAAGGYARGGATFSYQRGPDGQNYAVGGEVQIDTGKERTPEATILKMQIIRQAALAPADPSPQDQRVAAHATLQIAEASKELMQSRAATSQPAKPQAPEGGEDAESGGAARKVYQEAGADVAGLSPTPAANTRQGYAAYRTPYAPSGAPARQGGVDQIA